MPYTGRGFWSRLVVLALLAGMGVVALGQPASAATSVDPYWVTTNCGDCEQIVPRDGTSVSVRFGLSVGAPVGAATVTLNTAGIDSAKVSMTGVQGPCTVSGSLVTCNFGSVGKGVHTARIVLKAASASTPAASSAGTVSLRGTGSGASSGSISGRLRMSSGSGATDVSIRVSATSVPIGGVAAVTYTVRNHGPSSQSYVELRRISAQRNTAFVSADRCRLVSGLPWCRVDNLASGATVLFVLRYRVNGCDTGIRIAEPGGDWAEMEMGTADTNFVNDHSGRYQITVKGCSGSGSGSGGGVRPEPAPAQPTPSPSVAPSLSASAEPSDETLTTDPPALAEPSTVVTARQSGAFPWWPAALVVLFLLLALGGLLRWRHTINETIARARARVRATGTRLDADQIIAERDTDRR